MNGAINAEAKMPVVDTPVHEKVREKEGAVYGCWNKPRRKQLGYYVPERCITLKGVTYEATYVENTMSEECRFDMSLKDPKCDGCEWRGSGEKYDEMVRSKGK